MRVGFGRRDQRLDHPHPSGFDDAISRTGVLGVVVVNQDALGGYDAVEPRSRRPRSSPTRTPPEVVALILELRAQLLESGLDAGPQSILNYLRMRSGSAPSKATIWRLLRANGLVVPQPQKRPRSSWIRFQAELPNEMWQADATHWQLADGSNVEILNLIDDHSRFCLASVAFRTVKAADVLETFSVAAETYGYPVLERQRRRLQRRSPQGPRGPRVRA